MNTIRACSRGRVRDPNKKVNRQVLDGSFAIRYWNNIPYYIYYKIIVRDPRKSSTVFCQAHGDRDGRIITIVSISISINCY